MIKDAVRFGRTSIRVLAGAILLSTVAVGFVASPASASYTYWDVVARHSGKCLDVAGFGTADGINIQQWDCHGGVNQQWRLVYAASSGPYTYYTLRAAHSGKCLDVAGVSTADGANVHQWTCISGQLNQQWRRAYVASVGGFSYYRYIARHSGKCLDVAGVSVATGANIQQWTCISGTGQLNQQWSIV